MKQEQIETIIYHIDNKMLIKIERESLTGEGQIVGFPIQLTNKFLLMTVISDFYDEGFAILRTCDITDAYSKVNDEYYERICICEGLQDKISMSPIKDIADIKQILLDLQKYEGFVEIQWEEDDQEISFDMGKIKDVLDDSVVFQVVDLDGEWDDELDIIPFSNITLITFEDNYSKTFFNYMKK